MAETPRRICVSFGRWFMPTCWVESCVAPSTARGVGQPVGCEASMADEKYCQGNEDAQPKAGNLTYKQQINATQIVSAQLMWMSDNPFKHSDWKTFTDLWHEIWRIEIGQNPFRLTVNLEMIWNVRALLLFRIALEPMYEKAPWHWDQHTLVMKSYVTKSPPLWWPDGPNLDHPNHPKYWHLRFRRCSSCFFHQKKKLSRLHWLSHW